MALPLRIKITTSPDLSEVSAAYRRIRQQDLDKFTEQLAEIIWRHIREAAPKRTGTGVKAIQLKRRGTMDWEVVLDRRFKGGGYMTAQHEGVSAAKINPILPVRKKALWWPGLPYPVARVTNHPGIRANLFFDTGLDDSQSDLRAAESVVESEIASRIEK